MSESGPDRVIPADNLRTWERDGAVSLRTDVDEDDISSVAPVSIPSFVRQRCERGGHHPALAVKRGDGWKTWSYLEYLRDVRRTAKAFIHLGLEPMSSVTILGFNSPEWFFSSIGAVFAGGLSAGLYPTNSAEMNRFVMVDSRANVLVCEDERAVDKMWAVKNDVPSLKAVVQFSGTPSKPGVISWDELMEIGDNVADEVLEERLRGIAINRCAVLIYTSGTTGNPKGVMLSHDNLVFTAKSAVAAYERKDFEEVIVSFLPLSHIAAIIADIYVMLACVGTVHFAGKDALKGSLLGVLREVRPTLLLAVPRVWEKLMEGMQSQTKKVKGLGKKVMDVCLNAGLQHHLHGRTSLVYWLAKRMYFGKVRQALGLDRCGLMVSGAAPISKDTVEFFLSQDLVILELYGMSESTGPHTLSTFGQRRTGSVGRTMPGLSSRIDGEEKEGELCMWGRNVMMGYLGREDKTLEDMDEEGWMKTGDLATIDDDGFVFITGRIKELLITSGGENISPVPIEDNIKHELQEIVSNAILIGDRRKFLSAFLTLRTVTDKLTELPTSTLAPCAVKWCDSALDGVDAATVDDLLAGPDAATFMAAIQAGVDRANEKAVSNAARVQKWSVLPVDVSVAGGELGPTMKLKRFAFNEKYAEAIEKFYV